MKPSFWWGKLKVVRWNIMRKTIKEGLDMQYTSYQSSCLATARPWLQFPVAKEKFWKRELL